MWLVYGLRGQAVLSYLRRRSSGSGTTLVCAGLAVARAILWGIGCALCLQGVRAEEIDVEGVRFRVDREIRRKTYQLSWPLMLPADGKTADVKLAFVFAFQDANDFCRVDVTGKNWRVAHHDANGERVLGKGSIDLPPGQPWRQFVLKRLRNRLTGVLGGQHLFRIFDAAGGRGKAASRAAPEGLVGELKFQAIAESDMVFRDDFMRSPEENKNGIWETPTGVWKLQSYADQWKGDSPLDPLNSSRNPNPFVYRGAGAPMAIEAAVIRTMAIWARRSYDAMAVSCPRSWPDRSGLEASPRLWGVLGTRYGVRPKARRESSCLHDARAPPR